MKSLSFIIAIFALLWSGFVLASSGEVVHGNPPPNMDLLFRSINFMILVIGLIVLLRKPIAEFFSARSIFFKGAIEKNRDEHAAIYKENQVLQKRVSGLKAEIASLLAEYKDEGKQSQERLVAQAQEFAKKIEKDARNIVQSEIQRANEELKNITIEAVRHLAEQTILKEITAQDEDRLTNRFIERLEKLN